MGYDFVKLDISDEIATITMCDPKTLNAASLAMVLEMTDALLRAEQEARAVIITGEGRGFCSGANLGGDLRPDDPGYDAGACLVTHYNPLMMTIRDLRVPIVTSVNGIAAGVGCSIALAGDIIVAAESAKFLQAFQGIGLVPDGGSSFLLVHSAGRARAMELMLLGEKLPAATALEWGMINRVVPDAELGDTSRAFAKRLASGPTFAYERIRRLGWEACETTFEGSLRQERRFQREAGRTEDHRGAIAAFLAKTAAIFSGK